MELQDKEGQGSIQTSLFIFLFFLILKPRNKFWDQSKNGICLSSSFFVFFISFQSILREKIIHNLDVNFSSNLL